MLRTWGSYTQIGLFGEPISLDFERIAYRELRVTGTFSSPQSAWERAAGLLEEGAIDLWELVTDRFPLEEWEAAFAKARAKQGLKVVLTP